MPCEGLKQESSNRRQIYKGISGEGIFVKQVVSERMRRGQAGVEFLAVTAIGLLMIVGVSLFLLGQSRAQQDETALQQAQNGLTILANQAERVWALGRNSWVTVEFTLPETTSAFYSVEGNTLVMEIGTTYGLVAQPYFMPVPVMGGYDTVGERTNIFRTGEERGGPVRIRVHNNGTEVLFFIE